MSFLSVSKNALGSEDNPAPSAQAIINAGDDDGDGFYFIQNVGAVFCDMTTDGGGWMLLWSAPAGSTSATFSFHTNRSSGETNGEFDNFSLSYTERSAIREVLAQNETLVKTSGGWMRLGQPVWSSTSINSGDNYRFESNVNIVTSNGTTDNTAEFGLTNFDVSGGGDFGVAISDDGLDHHNPEYYNLNTGCENMYLYQYGDGYKVNTSLSGWSAATRSCENDDINDIPLAVYMR